MTDPTPINHSRHTPHPHTHPTPAHTSLARLIRHRRKEMQLTQQDLAHSLTYSLSSLRKVERGLRRPSLKMGEEIMQALHLEQEQQDAFMSLLHALQTPKRNANEQATAQGRRQSLAPQWVLPNRAQPQTTWPNPANTSNTYAGTYTGIYLNNAMPRMCDELIGRDGDLQALLQLMEQPDTRLVTVVGAPGVGKTQLALKALRVLGEQLNRQIYFASLVEVSTTNATQAANDVVMLLCRALGVQIQANDESEQHLSDALKDQKVQEETAGLLLVDNFEHVLNAAHVLALIAANLPHLKLIVTSRIPLQISNEHVFSLQPLPHPTEEEVKHISAALTPTALAQLKRFPAVQLFVKRARQANPHFELTQHNALIVADLCAWLAGLPLALEMAAARSNTLSLRRMLALLKQPGPLSPGGLLALTAHLRDQRDLPVRHHTLTNAIQWSYALLSAAEKTLLARLGIFAGPFTLNMVKQVCQGERYLLEWLVMHSLVQVKSRSNEAQSDESEYQLLPALRKFALERLAEMGRPGEVASLRERHARFWLAHFADEARTGNPSRKACAHYERFIGNIRAALAWSQSTQSEETTDLTLPMITTFLPFWMRMGHHSEAKRWLRGALQKVKQAAKQNMPRSVAETQAQFLIQVIRIITSQRAFARYGFIEMATRDALTAHVINRLERHSAALARQGEPALAMAILAVVLNRRVELDPFDSKVQTTMEMLTHLYDTSKLSHSPSDEPSLRGSLLISLSHAARLQVDLDKVLQLTAAGERLLRECGGIYVLPYLLLERGAVFGMRQEFDAAWKVLTEAFQLANEWGDHFAMSNVLGALGCITAVQDQETYGAVLLGAHARLVRAFEDTVPNPDQKFIDTAAEIAREKLGDAVFTEMFERGLNSSPTQAMAFAAC